MHSKHGIGVEMFYLLGIDRSLIYNYFFKLYKYILCSPFNGTYISKKVYERLHIESGFSVKFCFIGVNVSAGLESRPSSPKPK